MDLHLKGKVAIVTGGGRGIGKGCVQALAEEGVNIAVADRTHDNEIRTGLDEIAKKNRVTVVLFDCDVSDEDAIINLFDAAETALGPVELLVNNAGRGSIRKRFDQLTTADWRSVQDVTLNSQFFMSREFTRRAIETGRNGAIVNVLSKSAFTTNSIDNTTYISAKAGAYGLTKGIAKEMIGYGIRVNGIVPGYVQTERTYPDGDPRTERMRALLPMGKFATPHEIGQAVAFLLSDCSSQIIGAAIDITGGTML